MVIWQFKDKQPKDKHSNLMYGLKCTGQDCSESYVGATKQALKTTVNQHQQPSTNKAKNFAVFLLMKETRHFINTEDAIILDKEEQWYKSCIKEAICLTHHTDL